MSNPLSPGQQANWQGAKDAFGKPKRPLREAFGSLVNLINDLVPEINRPQPRGPGASAGPEEELPPVPIDLRRGVEERPGESGLPVRGDVPGPAEMPQFDDLMTRTERNEESDQERQLQEILVSLGQEIEVDGYAGPKTIRALNEVLNGLGIEKDFAVGDVIPGDLIGLLAMEAQ